MSSTFNFLDYNFSGLVSIFAALVGMAYPLIHQAIQRVDEMYGSTSLAGYVQRQRPIKRFNISLIVSIVFALTVPFLLRVFEDNEAVCICFSLLHSLVTLMLLLSVVSLYHFLQTTTRPLDMLEYIKTYPDGGRPEGSLVYAAQIAKFASLRNDQYLYFSATSHIAHVILFMRKNNQTFSTFPVEVRDTLWRLSQYFSESRTGLFAHSTVLSSVFFDLDGYYPFTDEDFGYIWRTLDMVLQSGSERFISSYWTFADQYYRFVLRRYPDDYYNKASVQLYRRRYQEFHIMLGSMLVYNKRFSLLKTIMYFSNEEPPSYSLIPSSFQEIHDSLVSLYEQVQEPQGLAYRYLMIGMNPDVNCDREILAVAYRYHAILLVRLFTINDYFTYSQSKVVPEVKTKIVEDIELDIQVTERLLAYIREYYGSDVLKECLPVVPKQGTVEDLISQYINKCKDQIKIIKDTHEIDYAKVEYIEDNMIHCAQGASLPPSYEDVKDDEEKQRVPKVITPDVRCEFPVSSEIIERGTYTNASNLPELIISELNNQMWTAYNSIFIRTKPKAEYSIDFRDIKHALDQLDVDGSYAVISLGVYLGSFDQMYSDAGSPFEYKGEQMFYKDIRFFHVPSASNSLVVLKKNEVPYYSLAENSDDRLYEVGKGLGLYSNLRSIKEIKEEEIPFITKRCVEIHYIEHLRYIRLNIRHYSGKRLDLDRITADIWKQD